MILGVTGGLACGKTTVSSFFSKFGFKVINADKIAHKLLDYRTRRNLRKIIFNNETEFKKLERLTHPFIIDQIKQSIKKSREENFDLIIDAPLLIEAGLDKLTDFLIVVKADRFVQLKRAKEYLGLSRAQAVKLIKRQMPLRKKIKQADFVIDNRGSLADMKKQARYIWREIKNKGEK
ncbi:MAG: dephospho-CoA kinase [Candidatus Omnitrophota bacterium]